MKRLSQKKTETDQGDAQCGGAEHPGSRLSLPADWNVESFSDYGHGTGALIGNGGVSEENLAAHALTVTNSFAPNTTCAANSMTVRCRKERGVGCCADVITNIRQTLLQKYIDMVFSAGTMRSI